MVYLHDVARWLERAEEARVQARRIEDCYARRQLQEIAEHYLRLVEWLEQSITEKEADEESRVVVMRH